MGFTNGLELVNNELAFAEHQNVELMGARGNQVIDGVGVTAQGTPDLTVAVASGNVLAGGVVVVVSAEATFAGTPNTFATTQGNLTSGQAEFVFIHIDNSGVITNTEGGAAAAGQQLPPDVPEDEVIIAMITLTEGDSTIDSVDIEDWSINVPKGGYFAGKLQVAQDAESIELGSGINTAVHVNIAGKRSFIGYDGSLSLILQSGDSKGIELQVNSSTFDAGTVALSIDTSSNIKNPVDNAGFFTGASDDLRMYRDGTNSFITSAVGPFLITTTAVGGSMHFRLGGSYFIQDSDDSTVTLFELNTTSRTLTIGASADNIDVGIGTTPTLNLDILGAANTTFANNPRTIQLHSTNAQAANMGAGISFGGEFTDASASVTQFAYIGGVKENSVSTEFGGKLVFGTREDGSGGSDMTKMIIDSSGNVKNQIDDAGFHTGASDELRVYHTGSAGNAFILNTVGSLILDQDTAAGDIELQLGGSVLIKDTDDGGVTLFDFNTDVSGGRTLVIGGVADNIGVRINGTLDVSGDVLPTADGGANLGSDAFEWDELFVQDQIIFSSPPVNVGLNLSLLGDSVVVASSSLSYKYDMDYLEDIEINATKIINALKPIKYRYNEDERIYKGHEFIKFGFAAEEFQLATEESLDLRNDNGSSLGIVYKDGKADGYEPMFLGAITVKALQEQNTYIKELERRILVLEGAK